MESDAAELFEKLPDPSSFKVHFLICTRVLKLVNRISRIFPAIAAACPQCLSGIQELSLLNHAIKQTQQHLQKCSESSILYLAVTGDVVVSQCQRLKNLLEQCLGQIQTMVQPELATEISHIMDYHGRATFTVDSSEEEAGKAVQRLLQPANSASDSIENSQVRSLQLAVSTLHITSLKAILIERQTINKQLDKVGNSDPRETDILRRLLYLLNKYGNLILQEQLSNDCVQNEGAFTCENGINNSAYSQTVDVESHTGCGHHEAQVKDILRRVVLPEEQLNNDCVQNEGAFAFENGRNDYAYSQSVDVESHTEEQLSNDCVPNKGEFAFENDRNNSAYSQSVDVESRTGCGHHEAQVDDIPRRAILPEEQLSNDCVQNEGEFAFENGRNDYAYSQSVDVESHTEEQLSNDCVPNKGEFAFENDRNNSAYSQSVDVESRTGCGHHEAQVDDIPRRAILPEEQLSNDCVQNEGEFAFENDTNNSAYSQSVDVESCTGCGHHEAQVDDILTRAIVPKEQLSNDCVQNELEFTFEMGRNNSAYSQSVDMESRTRCGHHQAQVDDILKSAIPPKEQLNNDCVQNEIAFAFEKLPDPSSFKVHSLVCTELLKLVDRISRIFPAIEASRPRRSSEMQELCSLSTAIDKAKLHLQKCSDSSKLYLAVTGDAVVSRSQKLKILLEQRLGQIKFMVQPELAVKISHIMDDLRKATFTLSSSEEEAGKALRGMLQQVNSESDSMENAQVRVLQLAASTLHITSPKAILIEKRSIKKQLDKANSDPRKTKILKYLLYLLIKYGNLILQEQSSNDCVQNEGAIPPDEFKCRISSRLIYDPVSIASNDCVQNEGPIPPDEFKCPMPPDEYKCHISSRLMYDPVSIASGQTFERMCIQKWFDEGNDTCPVTKMKLAHLSLTPNTAMKDLISKWCMRYGVTIPEPTMPLQVLNSWETSSTSIAQVLNSGVTIPEPTMVVHHFRETSSSSIDSLFSSMNGRCLSSTSRESLDFSYGSDSPRTGIADGLNLIPMQTKHEHKCQSYGNIDEEDLEFLSELAGLQWEYQCEVIDNVKKHLDYSEEACQYTPYENFFEPLVRFLKDARDLHDVKAQKAGSQLLLAFVTKDRSGISYLCEEAFSLLATFINSEITKEALEILEVLSVHSYCRAKIAASGAVTSILKMLDSNNRDFQELAIKILCNLSSNSDICSHIVSLECIPKLVPLLADSTLAGNCAHVLKNLCNMEEARVSVAETNGCISSVAGLLATGSHEDQENAVAVLLSLCSQRVQYCQLVMDEGVVPDLVDISINGNDKGRVSALELLRCLRDVEYDNDRECLGSLDTSYTSSPPQTTIADGLNLTSMQTKEGHKLQSYENTREMDSEFLSKLAERQWESQCKVVEDIRKHLTCGKKAFHHMSSANFVEPLVKFLKDAHGLRDVQAQKAGSQLLLAFVTKDRSGISYLREEAFSLLATFINSEITKEALELLEVLSGYSYCRAKIAASGAVTSILKMLDSNNRDFQELAIKILCNLSSNSDICSHIVSLECIPKLVPLLADSILAGNCAHVLKNLCNMEEAKVSVAETNGCISSVAGLLATGSHEDQENAVAVLLSLCSQRVQYCQLVMDEGVIPDLVDISINGNDKGRVSALELLRCLRDVEYDNDRECLGSLDTSYTSSPPQTKIVDGLNLTSMQTKEGHKLQSYENTREMDLEFLSKLAERQWESQCKVVEDIRKHLTCGKKAFHHMSSANFVEPLVKFLKDAHGLHDVQAQKAGSRLLLAFVTKDM